MKLLNFFNFYIVCSDTLLCRKWEKAFLRENWKINIFENFSKFKLAYTSEKALLFIEIGLNTNINADEVKKNFHAKNLSIIAFADENHINDSLIATFLESCCDDFIPKSLNERILIAKTKAHLRRLLPSTNYLKTVISTKKGDIKIDTNKKTVEIKNKTKKTRYLENLTPKEFEIFSILICHEGDIVPRALILEYIWRKKAEHVYSETVNKHVESLRRKLGVHGKKIKTIYGSGYVFKNV